MWFAQGRLLVLQGPAWFAWGPSCMTTSITMTQVTKPPADFVLNMNFDKDYQHNVLDEQNAVKSGYAPAAASKKVSTEFMHTPQQVIEFGWIREEDVRGVRSSGRLSAQPNADATQMERAMKIAKQRADLPVLGKSPLKSPSITLFTDDHIVQNDVALGVSLGNSHSDCVASARLIKDVELQRNLTMLKKSDSLVKDTAFV
jgi:hypothetical protein